MPSTVVHVALAGLLAAALLTDAFDWRALLVVLAATVFIDLDVFLGFVVLGAHRAAFHTLLLPLGVAALLVYDTRVRDRSLVRARFGGRGVRVAWVSVAAVVFAGIGPDVFFNGANLFYPLHDQFYSLDGRLLYSNQRGIVQTFIEEQTARGSTTDIQFRTGVDPTPDRSQPDTPPERIFPVVTSGFQLLLVLTSAVVLSVRLWESRTRVSR